jgi:demethylmenaquinone methyltransferase / 2-methoxy-6-polyprenyl-1,4-benzoquinol methylase
MPVYPHYIGVGPTGNPRLNEVSCAAMVQVPHGPLKNYYAHEADRHDWVRRIFDQTAGDYDRVERVMALGSGSWYRRRALTQAGLQRGMRVLDVGAGTGLTAREAARLVGSSGQVTGVDPSAGMMERAIVPAGVQLLLGSAEAIPLPADTVDFLSMGYALRHVADLSVAFSEFMRVLVPGGRICILEITSPAGRVGRTLLKAYMRGVVPLAARCIARHRDVPKLMRYYWDTIEACASPNAIMASIREAGFVDVHRTVSLGVFSEYCARKP